MRRLILMLVAMLLIGTPAVVVAETHPVPHEGDATAPAPIGNDHGHGKSKLGPFEDIKRYDLGIYTLVVFGILFFILGKFAWGPFAEGMRKREAGILAARDEAIKAKHEAEELRVKLKAEFDSAHEKIRGMMDEARRDAEALRTAERETGVREAASERDRAKREIETAKEHALQEIYQKSIQLASLMSSKAVRRTLSADDHARLLDESLSELRTSVSRN